MVTAVFAQAGMLASMWFRYHGREAGAKGGGMDRDGSLWAFHIWAPHAVAVGGGG